VQAVLGKSAEDGAAADMLIFDTTRRLLPRTSGFLFRDLLSRVRRMSTAQGPLPLGV